VASHPFRRKKRKGWGTEVIVATAVILGRNSLEVSRAAPDDSLYYFAQDDSLPYSDLAGTLEAGENRSLLSTP
jgi:hypothetical protein